MFIIRFSQAAALLIQAAQTPAHHRMHVPHWPNSLLALTCPVRITKLARWIQLSLS